MRKLISILTLTVFLPAPTFALQQENIDLKQIAHTVAGKAITPEEKARRLATWINTSFNWSATDYQKRSVEDIVRRRAGNCAELADVLFALLQASGVHSRWVAEINIHPRSERRQASAEGRITLSGNRASVFGLMHNDHRWLEVYDESSKSWFPADPAVGVVSTKEWVTARLGFGERPTSPVPAIAGITKNMIAPFVVVAMESRGGKPVEDRSKHYLIDQFSLFYGSRLESLPSWAAWSRLVGQLSKLGASTFAGETNLHQHAELIAQLSQVYERLRQEALDRGLVTKMR